MTGYTLIQGALRLSRCIGIGQTPTGDQYAAAMEAVQELIDAWDAERLAIFTITRQTFNLGSGQATRTVGAGGQFDIPRPPKIERYGVISQPTAPQPLELPMRPLTLDQWASIPIKTTTSTIPLQVYDDAGFPLRTLNFWPVPSAAVQIALYPWTRLVTFSDFTTDITFPPAYAKALRFNLAIALAPEYGKDPAAWVVEEAREARAALKRLNIQPIDLRCDPALIGRGGAYNWMTDGYTGFRQS